MSGERSMQLFQFRKSTSSSRDKHRPLTTATLKIKSEKRNSSFAFAKVVSETLGDNAEEEEEDEEEGSRLC